MSQASLRGKNITARQRALRDFCFTKIIPLLWGSGEYDHGSARQGSEAAAEFQKILEHRGVSPVNPLYALAHPGLARGAPLASDAAKSRKAYQDFLALWKDADPDIPILNEAKAEYAKLK